MKKIFKILAVIFSLITAVSVMFACAPEADVVPPVTNGGNSQNSQTGGDGGEEQKPQKTPEEIEAEKEALEAKTYGYYPQISEVMPAIHINTPDGSNTWATKYNQNSSWSGAIEYVSATIDVKNCEDKYKKKNQSAQVKVRGNYTLSYAKKPIRIKFENKHAMLGLHGGEKYKNWVLLADWKDLSMMNNTMAFYLGNTILGSDGYYSSDFRNVEVYLNGSYWGVYLLCEQQEIKDNRTSASEVPDDYTGTDIGYFFEYDGYYDKEAGKPIDKRDPTFTMTYGSVGGRIKGYTVKSDIYDDTPDDNNINNSKQVQFLQSYMNNIFYIASEAIVNKKYYKFNANYSQVVEATNDYENVEDAVSSVIDLPSLVDTYILNELACDLDLDWSSFYMSLDMSASGSKKLVFEAPWDFDSSFGICNTPNNLVPNAEGLYTLKKNNPWFNLIKTQSWFKSLVAEKWAKLKKYGVLENAFKLIEEQKTTYKDYYIKNYRDKWSARVKNGNSECVSKLNDYNDIMTAQGEAAEYLKDWLTKRVNYLDTQFVKPVEFDENIPAGSTAYPFEAEEGVFGGGITTSNIRTEKDYASNYSYLGSLGGAGKSVTFNITADEDTTAYLFLGVSKRTSAADINTWFTVTVNGVSLYVPERIVPAISNGEEDWHTFIAVKLAPVQLKAGDNVIVVTTQAVSSNFDYIELYSTVSLDWKK